MAILFKNNYQTTLAANITAVATSITIAAGSGAALGTLGSDVYYATIYDGDSPSTKEIVKITARSTDTLTVTRAQESTTAQAWNAGAFLELRVTAGILASFSQSGVLGTMATQNANAVAITGGTITGITDLAVADGGTGASTQSGARTNLGLGTISTQDANNVSITGGSISGITDLAVADGGTGSSTLSANAVLLGNGTSALQTVAPSTSGNVLTSNGTTWVSSTPTTFTLGTPQATTSGTNIDFTSIPTGTKVIKIMFKGVSTNGSSNFLVQIGDSGGVETSGYIGGAANSSGNVTSTSGCLVTASAIGAASTLYGILTLSLENSSSFSWAFSGVVSDGAILHYSASGKSLSAELDRVRITTVSGDTFDAGEINITYSR